MPTNSTKINIQGSKLNEAVEELNKMVKFSLNGKYFYTTKGSRLLRILPIIRKRKVFTTRDIAKELGEDVRRISDVLTLLYKRGAIERTPVISLDRNVRERIYYLKGYEYLVPEYLLNKLDPDDRKFIEELIFSKTLKSSIRLEKEGFRNFKVLNNFVKVGLVKKKTIHLWHENDRSLVNVFYSPRLKEKEIERLIEKEKEILREYVKNAVRNGRTLEKEVEELAWKITFKPVDVKRNQRIKLRNGIEVEFDVIAIFKPFIKDKPIGYCYGKCLVVAFSCKELASGNSVLEIVANARDIFPNAIVVLVAENITESVLREAEKREILLIASKKLKELRELAKD